MYKCKVHGDKKLDWCDECNTILKCDCSNTGSQRFKDLIYDTSMGERTVTIWLRFCDTCGDIVGVDF